jgi:hypothetical protein
MPPSLRAGSRGQDLAAQSGTSPSVVNRTRWVLGENLQLAPKALFGRRPPALHVTQKLLARVDFADLAFGDRVTTRSNKNDKRRYSRVSTRPSAAGPAQSKRYSTASPTKWSTLMEESTRSTSSADSTRTLRPVSRSL